MSQLLYTPKEAYKLIQSGAAVAVDVRDHDAYESAHLPGAANIPQMFYELSMSTSQGIEEMRNTFVPLFSKCGLSKDKIVIIYEDSLNTRYGGSCRGYFQLTFFGHPHAAILDGGLAAWEREGLPLVQGEEALHPTVFEPELNEHIFVTKSEMRAALSDPSIKLLDNRDADEWRGESSSPYGVDFTPRKGRLPHARWVEWYNFMEERDGIPRFKSPEKIRALCAQVGLYPVDDIIVYCFKGARASNTYIALKIAGFEKVRNYYGSWNEWSRDAALPIDDSVLVAA